MREQETDNASSRAAAMEAQFLQVVRQISPTEKDALQRDLEHQLAGMDPRESFTINLRECGYPEDKIEAILAKADAAREAGRAAQ